MTTHRKTLAFRGNFIDGTFQKVARAEGFIERASPADLDDTFESVSWSTEAVDQAVEAAARAQIAWKRTPLAERVQKIDGFKERLKLRRQELAEIIAREVGKPVWEALTEIDAMVGKIDISKTEGLKDVETREIADIQPGVFGVSRYKPLGVTAVLGPFNFPAHLPNGHWVPALLAGNSVVFKPSEQTPYIGQLIAECFAEAGLPAGVFNLVHGDRAVGEKLAGHAGVSGVFFTGSYPVGRAIKLATIDQPHKLLALEMGGKNATLVFEDAHADLALAETITSAFLTSGQRCSATSRIIVHESLIERFSERLVQLTKKIEIGHPFESVFMGPLINGIVAKRYLEAVKNASSNDLQILAPATVIETKYRGHYVSPSLSRYEYRGVESLKANRFLNEELFAPHATLISFKTFDEAIEIANTSEYGLVSSVFTQNLDLYRRAHAELVCGLINWNKSTVGGSSRLPFGGLKKSGNFFPTALFASRYCGHPVASLENRTSAFVAPKFPGLNWE